MKKVFLLMLSLIVLGATSAHAQVTIGSDSDPTPGAVLDLQSGGGLGFLLPQVILTSATEWLPVAGTPTEGMTVYNASTSSAYGLDGKGIYVWISSSWNKTGASTKSCVEVSVNPITHSNFVDKGANQTLGAVLMAGSPPYNFLWKKGGTILQETQNTSNFQNTFQTQEFGTYVCEVSNRCSPIPRTVTFNVVNSSDYNQGGAATIAGATWFLSGIICFDVSSSLVASSPYALTLSNATVTDVAWTFEDPQMVLNGLTGDLSGATLHFKDCATVAVKTPATVVITAYITMNKASTTYRVVETKTIQFLNTRCCDGAVIVNGAYDYFPYLPGDGAKNGGVDNYCDAAWSPNVSIPTGFYNANAMNPFFTAAGKDLCVYKADGNTGSSVTWKDAVNNCADGSYADGDGLLGWYLPNERELQAIYNALGGNGSDASNFANIQAPSYIATTADAMNSIFYWSSTEQNDINGYYFQFNNGARGVFAKVTNANKARCVRRM